jgi:hypothetical protein
MDICLPKGAIGYCDTKIVAVLVGQMTFNVQWMIRGILEHEHQVPHRSIGWFKQDDEKVEWTPVLPK